MADAQHAHNTIPAVQNEPEQIRLLRASSHLYGQGKRLLAIQVTLTVLIPVAGTLATLVSPSLKGITAFYSLLIAAADVALLERIQRSLRRTAAKVQEEFDCRVLVLPWDEFTAGSRLEHETVYAAADRYLRGKENSKLRDWYPPACGALPIHLARLVCQRTNLWYDSKLRRRFGAWVLAVVLVTYVAFFAVSLVEGLTLETFVLTVLAPASPVTMWGIREIYRQRDTADLLDRLRSEAERLWQRAKEGQCSESDCAVQAREFQNAIYEHRRTSPFIFNWIYRLLRSALEQQMNQGAEALVREIVGR